jgi:hypothetical protein
MLPAVTAIPSGNFEIGDQPICSAPTARAASVGAPQRQGRMVVGMFPPSANHSLQLCSRKPSCS